VPPHSVSTFTFSSAREAADFLRDLIGEFACRAENERLHIELARVELGKQRQRKGRRLAAARFRLRDEIVARERRRQARGLDRRHRQIAELLQVRLHRRRERQTAEGGFGRHDFSVFRAAGCR